VVTPPIITAQPSSQAGFEGDTVSLTVGTANNALLYYQWRQGNGRYLTNLTDGPNISRSRTGTLTLSKFSPANTGADSLHVSNAAGTAISSQAFLTILPWRPVITVQPASQTVYAGQNVIVKTEVVGSQPLIYHWQKGGFNLSDGGNTAGSSTSTLTLSSV